MKQNYGDFNSINLAYLKKCVQDNTADNEMVYHLLRHWESKLQDFRKKRAVRYFDYYITFESMNEGIIYAFIYDLKEEKTMFQFKPLPEVARILHDELEFTDKNELEENSEITHKAYSHLFWKKKISFRDNHYLLGVVFIAREKEESILHRLETVFKNYYLPEIFLPDERFTSYPEEIDQYIRTTVNTKIKENGRVQVVGLKFVNYKLFIHSSGDFYTEDALDIIKENFENQIRNEGYVFALGLNCWLIFYYGTEFQQIIREVDRHIMEVKNYMFKFHLTHTELSVEQESFFPIWKKMLGELPQN